MLGHPHAAATGSNITSSVAHEGCNCLSMCFHLSTKADADFLQPQALGTAGMESSFTLTRGARQAMKRPAAAPATSAGGAASGSKHERRGPSPPPPPSATGAAPPGPVEEAD